jgi:hypothetical protein
MSNTKQSKTKTALEVKSGDMVRVKGYEFWVESVRINKDHQVTLWGSWVITLGASEAVIITQENWGE